MNERKRSIGVKEGACWRTRDKKAKKFAADFVDDIIAEEEEDELLINASSNTKEPILDIAITIQQEEESNLAFPESHLITSTPSKVAPNVNSIFDESIQNQLEESISLPQTPVRLVDIDQSNSSLLNEDSFATEPLLVPRSIYLPLLSIGLYLKHKLTKSALADHLRVLRLNENSHIKQLASVHNLLSKYRSLETEISKFYICGKKNCGSVLVLDRLKKNPVANQPCGHKRKPVFSSGRECFVLKLPIAKQIVHFIQNVGLSSERDDDPRFRGDITTGECYRKLHEQGVIDNHTITLQLNTDGAELFENSEYSFWPLMGIVNEVGYKLRRSYVILLAIYYGNKKPPMHQFLKESFHELNILKNEGLYVNNIRYKVEVIVVTVDSVARAPLLGMTLFNGAFGCGFCLAEGKRVSKGRGSVRVYPESFDAYSNPPPLRTLEQHSSDLKKVLKTGKPINGILGPSALSLINGFDYIKGLVPEYLHSCCEGVFKLLINLWTLPKFRKKDWFIGDQVSVVNKRLSEIKPPYEVTRTHSTAGISKLSTWKASMFRSFFLYYFPILEGLLPNVYFQHCCQLVYGMNLLLRERVSVDDVKKVEILFREFVRDFELLYTVEEVRINVHFLLHLPQAVLNWGCLWSTSTFIPEWFNGELVKLGHGSQGVAEQMAKNYLLRIDVRREVEDLIEEKALPSHVLQQLKEYFNLPMNDDEDDSKGLLIAGGRYKFLGNPVGPTLISLEEEDPLRSLLLSEKYAEFAPIDHSASSINFGKATYYSRFKVMSSKSIFTTSSYTLAPKRLNCCALMNDGSFIFIDHIINFDTAPVWGLPRSFILGRKLGTESKATFTPEAIDGTKFEYFAGQTTKLVGVTDCLTAYELGDVVSKCVVSMKNELVEQYVVTSLVNNFETD